MRWALVLTLFLSQTIQHITIGYELLQVIAINIYRMNLCHWYVYVHMHVYWKYVSLVRVRVRAHARVLEI